MARLQRTLSLGSVVLFGIAYMTPIIVLGTFGILAQSTAGMVPAAYLAALVAMFFTAMSYGRMAAAFPSIPQWIWVLGFIGITSAINIIGLKLANGINALLMLVQFLVLIAFVALCVHYIGGDASTPLWSIKPFFNGDMQMPLIMSGAAIACYSFLGFDAVSTLTEETRDPRRTIPRAALPVDRAGGGLVADGQPRSPGGVPGLELAGDRRSLPGSTHRWFPSPATGNGLSASDLRRLQAAGRFWRIGNSMRKVVPTPGSLRTEMSPPCFFTMP